MKLTNYKVLCMIGLMAMSALVAQAQDVIVTPKTKTETTTTTTTPAKETLVTKPKQTPKPTPKPQATSQTFTVNGVVFKMIYVEGLCSPYYIGETEVTQELWQAVMGNNPSKYKGYNLPVEQVSWNDCKEFIQKLNSITGKSFRLPTDSEWKHAAKGGNKSKGYTYSGSNDIDEVSWYYENSGNSRLKDKKWKYENIEKYKCCTHNVKTKKANELGIYDMSGNVYEWCEDSYNSSATIKIMRGGGCYNQAFHSALSSVSRFDMNKKSPNMGFRLAM